MGEVLYADDWICVAGRDTGIMKSEFLTQLEVKNMTKEKLWELMSPLQYLSDIYGGIITVPTGFVTDLASVPRVPGIYAVWGNRAHHESVLHDFMYQTCKFKKSTADRIFLEAMESRGKPWHIRWGMYAGVVIGGTPAYVSGHSRCLLFGNKT